MLWTVQHALFFVSLGRESAMVGKCKYMSTVCVCGGVWCVCVCGVCVCVVCVCVRVCVVCVRVCVVCVCACVWFVCVCGVCVWVVCVCVCVSKSSCRLILCLFHSQCFLGHSLRLSNFVRLIQILKINSKYVVPQQYWHYC